MVTSPKTDNALELIKVVRGRGLTWQELAAASGQHHGSASAMLSKLHARGDVVRLAEKRQGSGVYVLPEFVAGRPEGTTRAQAGAAKRPKTPPVEAVDTEALLDALEALGGLQRAAERLELEARLLVLEEELEAMRQAADLYKRQASNKLGSQTRRHKQDLVKQAEEARAEGHEAGEAFGWQVGYDEGVKRAESLTAGADAFIEGRAMGRDEGEEVMRKRVAAVGGEMYRVITERAPLRSHFKGCYAVHSECAVRAIMRSAGITTRPMSLYQAG